MPSIFHYTNARGLLGILSSRSLFATDSRFLNDSTETSIIRQHVMPIFEAEVAAITPKFVQKGWISRDFIKEYGMRGQKLQAEEMYHALTRATGNISPWFVCSFCRHKRGSEEFEHGLLSQWRGYAESDGFAIEFDEVKLDKLIHREQNAHAYGGFRTRDVHYRDDEHKATVSRAEYRRAGSEIIRQIFECRGIDVSGVTGKRDIKDVINEFAATAPFLKHWGFHEEQEYRVMMTCFLPNEIAKEEKRSAKPIKFRMRSALLVPYIELFESFQEPLPIKAIIVGPHPNQHRQAEAVWMALKVNDMRAAEIRLSAIPYQK